MIDSALKDSEDTIFIWLKDDVDGKSFIDFAERAGTIKTDRETALRMAEMRTTNKDDRTKECIVTYEQKEDVKKAFKILEELQSNGQVIKVLSAKDYIKKEGNYYTQGIQELMSNRKIKKGLLFQSTITDWAFHTVYRIPKIHKYIKDCYRPGEKIAWCFWRLQTDKHHLRGGGDWQFRGQDGEPGGPGGQGGRGGKGGGFY